MATTENSMFSRVVTSWLKPLPKNVAIVSTSFVRRDMTLPEVYDS